MQMYGFVCISKQKGKSTQPPATEDELYLPGIVIIKSILVSQLRYELHCAKVFVCNLSP